MLQLRIVQNGTLEISPEKGMTDNRPTCTLIQSEGWNVLEKWNVLIDIDHPVKNASDIIHSLSSLEVRPEQVKVVILTHLHPDHIGHKDIFPNALFMYHKDERLSFYFKNDRRIELEGDALYELSDDGWPVYVDEMPNLKNLGNSIYIRHCPGHTRGSLVIFSCIDQQVYACVGGIFLNREYYEKSQPPGMSWKEELIYNHMAFIKHNADVIVPGHGAPFVL